MARERLTTSESADELRERPAECALSDADRVRERQLLEAHVDNSPLAVIEFDPEFRVMRWAASAERIFGYSAEEMIGKRITDIRWVYEEDAPIVARESAQLFDGTKVRGVNINRNYRKDGSVIWCEWYSSAIRGEDGELLSVLSLVLDITERKRAEETARRELDNTHVLLDAAAALASGRSLGEVLDAFCDALLVTLPHERVIVSLWDEARQSIVTVASKGREAVTPGQVLRLADLTEPGRHALQSREAQVIDYDNIKPEAAHPLAPRPSHLALAVPLVYGDRLVGLFTIDDPGARREFGEREMEIALGIASQASIAIEHARLYDAERERMRLGEALGRVDLAIHGTLEWDEIARRALSETAAALGADAAIMLGQEGRDMVVWADFGFTPSIRGRRFVNEPGILAAAEEIRRHGIVAVDDVASQPRFAETLGAFGEKSVVAAPLVVRGQTIGAFGVSFRRAIHHFTRAEIDAVGRVASALSLALENARLYATERGLADRLQEAMMTMPDRIDGLEFAHAYHSAEEAARVGGDFYDVFEGGHGLVGITIGDVAGKGLEAAVLTSLAKNTIRAHASEAGKAPAEVLGLTSEVVLQATPAESFVTVFFGLLDRDTGKLTYANAGHTVGVLARGDGTTVRLEPTGTLCGALPDVTFGQVEVELTPEDLLFLYTDGLTEARRDGVQYGEERVFRVLADGDQAPLDACRRVADDVLDYTRHHLSDDLAMLAVKRLRPAEPAPRSAGLEV